MPDRPRLAVVSTVYYPLSHSDVIVSRWLEPRPTDRAFGWPAPGFDRPRTDIVSAYIAQFPENDMGRETLAQHNVPLFSTVREALTLGGDSLAVDGVLLIGEHGDYPENEWSQKMYPRRELFDEITDVFRSSGRSVPVFCDKHLSYDAASAQHMVATARALGFPLMAGSSIPVNDFLAPWLMPQEAVLKEGVGIFYGALEAYGYHSIDFLQSLVAKRAGGESGIKSVTAYRGESFWEAQKSGVWSSNLLEAALQQARNCEGGDYRENATEAVAYCFEHYDGLRTSHLALTGHLKDFIAAVQETGGAIHSACSQIGMNDRENNYYAHFAALNAHVEEFILTGKSPSPVEHYLLSTLAISAAMHALARPGETLSTPDLRLSYQL